MTLVISTDFNLSFQERRTIKADAAQHVRALAASVLGIPQDQVDIRDAVAGGAGVTSTATTGLPTSDFSLSSQVAVDFVLNGIGTTGGANTFVGWLESASAITAYTLSNISDGTKCPPTKTYTFYGIEDLTAKGDLNVLRFRSGPNKVKAYFETTDIYESSIGNLVGGHFADSDTGTLGYIDYGVILNEEIEVETIFQTSADKALRLRLLVGEKAGEAVNVVATEQPVSRA